MNIGLAGTWVAFLAAILSGFLYLAVGTGQTRLRPLADWMFRLQVFSLAALAGWLLYLLLTHQFQYSYVANYSSRELATVYVVSAFWGGQQGTFLMWALFGGLMGLVLARSSNRIVPTAMFFLNWAQIMLLLILVIEGPFKLLAQAPANGQGLNPLLQDYWMAIHPPILFIGFSSMVIPFALAMSTLCHRDKASWLRITPPWVMFSTVVLGTGFTLGGVWAYKVLGWGGFWAWDPVENTSLVPWIFAAALFHGLLVQRATGALFRTNLFLALLPFLFVLYGSFLTRSGVLADFSVHSFVDLGLNAYLLSYLGVFAVAGVVLWLIRSPGLADPHARIQAFSREFTIWLGMLTFILMGFLTMLGTSAPLVSRLFGAAGAVQMSYYNVVNGLLGVLLLTLAGVGPLLHWRHDSAERFGKTLVIPSLAALVAVLIGAAYGLRGTIHLLLVGGAGFAFAANFQVTMRAMRRGPVFASGYLSHLGVAIMLVGILSLAQFGKAKPVELPLGQPRQVLGFELTYQGLLPQPDGKTRAAINVRGGGREFQAETPIWYSEFSRGMMRNPHVERFLMQDIYIAPIEVVTANQNAPEITLAKGESEMIGETRVTFVDFEMEAGAQEVRAAAEVFVEHEGERHKVVPAMVVNSYGRSTEPAEFPGGGVVSLAGLDPDGGRVLLSVRTPEMPEMPEALAVEVSTKPLINFVWFGMAVLLTGTLMAIFRRTRGPGSLPATPSG
jgi:cytochrome c-type biogenesis protein CcmF